MNRESKLYWIIGALIVVLLFALGCITNCPDEDDADRAPMTHGDHSLSQIVGGLDGDSRLHPDDELYIRVLSDDTVEVLYERDDEIIAETYEVTDRDTEVIRY